MDVEDTYNKAKFRGKLYALSHESAWEDTGTGFVAIIGNDDNRRLIFKEEEGGKILHDRPVFASDTYQLPGEGDRQTIIVWEDPETDKDWALSFQDPDGTTEIWEAISNDPCSLDDKRILPLPKLGALAECSRLLACVPPSQREMLASECQSTKFLAALRESFLTVEDLGNEEALSHIWQIAKGIFLLSNQKLTERYLAADVYEDVLGMLEYDDGLPPAKRIAHRQVMKVKVRFSQVLSFEDAAMLERVHLNYRLQYLKDIVLPRLLDDGAFASLTQMIHVNISIILDYLQRSSELLDRLFAQIREKDLQSLLFLQDMCRLSRQIVPSERAALHERMVERHVFEVLTPFVAGGPFPGESETLRPKHCAAEVLLAFATNDPNPLRRFLTCEADVQGRALLSAVVWLMLNEEDQGVQGQICEMLKQIMDPSPLEERERDTSFDAFYERGAMSEIVAPLRLEAGWALSPGVLFGQQLVCELLAFAVTHHGYRSKIFIVRHGVAQLAARLLSAPQRYLQLAPIRLIKAMVMSKDEAYHRYLTKSGVFAPLLRNFQLCCRPPALGGNLVVSATLELVEFIRVENVKLLVDHICRKHGAIVQEHAPRFKMLEGLLLKHQQNLEYEAFPPDQHAAGGPLSSGAGSRGPSQRRSPGREDDSDEEAYFESLDDDEDEEVSAGGASPQDANASGLLGVAPGASLPNDEKLVTPNGTGAGTALNGLLSGYEDEEEADGGDSGDAGISSEAGPGCDAVTVNADIDASVAEEQTEDGSSLDAAAGEVVDENGKGVLNDVENNAGAKDVQSLGHVPKRLKTSATS